MEQMHNVAVRETGTITGAAAIAFARAQIEHQIVICAALRSDPEMKDALNVFRNGHKLFELQDKNVFNRLNPGEQTGYTNQARAAIQKLTDLRHEPAGLRSEGRLEEIDERNKKLMIAKLTLEGIYNPEDAINI